MTDEIEALEPVEPPAEVAPVEQEHVDPYAEEAKKYGWVEPEDFDPANGAHMSAEKFMTRGPGTSRKLNDTVSDLTKQLADEKAGTKARMDRFERAQKANEENRIQARAAAIAEAQRTAAESGDMEEYDRLAGQKDIKPGKAPASVVSAEEEAAVEEWVNRPENDWFSYSEEGNKTGIRIYNMQRERDVPYADALNKVTDWMRREHPSWFPDETPPATPRTAAAVDSGGLASRGAAKKGWANIPAEDRAMVKAEMDRGEWNAKAKEMKTSPQEAFASLYWGLDG